MRLSIIVPVYNTEKYIQKCIESLLNQNYDNYEIVLVDDGSTDNSGKICDSYSTNEKVRVIHKENTGCSLSRNYGLKHIDSDYVMFIDSDDWVEENTLGDLMYLIDTNNLDVLRYNYVKEYKTPIKKLNTILEERVYVTKDECLDILSKIIGIKGNDLSHPENFNFLASCCLNIYRRNVITENNLQFIDGKKVSTFGDGLFNIDVFSHINRFQFVNTYFYHYRKTNDGSATAKYRKELLSRQLKLFEEIKERVSKLDRDFGKEIQNRIALTTMELCLNAVRNTDSAFKRIKEIKSILKNKAIAPALKQFELKYLPLKWKVFYFCAKHKFALMIYLMSRIMQKMKGRV